MTEVQTTGSKAKYWLFTLVSLLGLAALLMFAPEWCWLAFPFVFTGLVLAFDAI